MNPLDYQYLRTALKARTGIDLSADGQSRIESRLEPVARRHGLGGTAALVRKMRSGDEGVIAAVAEATTTSETSFFRDKTPFGHLRDDILPALLKARAGKRRLRIWCAASSSGQEPYSIAICLKEAGAALADWRCDILATDLSSAVLEKSSSGIYSQFEVQHGLPIAMLLKYFTKAGDAWQIHADIRAMVEHRQLNLLHDFSQLGVFDIVFCRNVLTCFDQSTGAAILERIARQIEGDGFLALGAAESVAGRSDAFAPIVDRCGIYRPNITRAGSIVPSLRGALRVVA